MKAVKIVVALLAGLYSIAQFVQIGSVLSNESGIARSSGAMICAGLAAGALSLCVLLLRSAFRKQPD